MGRCSGTVGPALRFAWACNEGALQGSQQTLATACLRLQWTPVSTGPVAVAVAVNANTVSLFPSARRQPACTCAAQYSQQWYEHGAGATILKSFNTPHQPNSSKVASSVGRSQQWGDVHVFGLCSCLVAYSVVINCSQRAFDCAITSRPYHIQLRDSQQYAVLMYLHMNTPGLCILIWQMASTLHNVLLLPSHLIY